jgi:hypothetical protein
MIKFLYISDSNKESLTLRFFNKVCEPVFSGNLPGSEVEKILKEEKLHFLYLDIKEPANIDYMRWLSLNNFMSLRVSVFTIKPFRSRLMNYLFPPVTIEKAILGLFNHPALKK